MERLTQALDDAVAGRRRVVLLGGAPGIGKTRLCEEIAAHAAERGASLVWGRSWELDGSPPFWPWTQVLRDLLRHTELAGLKKRLGSAAPMLAPLLPLVREVNPELAATPALDSAQARFQLLEAIVDVLERCIDDRPHVIILDDLHAADRASLLALEFLAQDARAMPLLVVGTYRDAVIDPDGPLAQSLPELGRAHATESIHLSGLAASEVAELVTGFTGRQASPGLIDRLHRQTEGHPLFLAEILRAFVLEGTLADLEASITGLPSGLRDAVGRHLAPLSPACRGALRCAAVLGREFGADLLAAATGRAQVPLVSLLDEALSAGVLVSDPAPAHYRFTHVVVRDVLYAELPRAERLAVHQRVGHALATRPGVESRLAQIAYHLVETNPSGDEARRAVDYARRAAEAAAAVSAFEEAARLYALALQTLEATPDGDRRQRAELLVGRGEALNRAGEIGQAMEVFVTATTAARGLDDRELLSRAVLGYGGGMSFPEAGFIDRRHIEMLEEAIAAWGDEVAPLHARLLGRLGAALYFTNSAPRRMALAARSVGMARALGNLSTLADTLADAHAATWGPNPGERLALASELLQLAQASGSLTFAFTAHQLRYCDLIELDDFAAAEGEFAACEHIAAELREPASAGWVLVFRALRAALAGRFEAADRHVEEVLMSGRWLGRTVERIYVVEQFALCILRDRWKEHVKPLQELAALNPGIPAIRSGLALFYAHAGYRDEALSECEYIVDRLDEFPLDRNHLVTLSHIGETCAVLGDARRTEIAYTRLLPHEGLNVTNGNIFAYLGPVSYYLGIMAGALARPVEATAHFERALDSCFRCGARPWAARIQVDFAAMLADTSRGATLERVAGLLREACATADELGMPALKRRAEEFAAARGIADKAVGRTAPAKRSHVESANGEHTGVFRREADYWTIQYDGNVVRVKHAKGLDFLAHLLRHPGREFLALDLAVTLAPDDRAPNPTARAPFETTEPRIDAEAMVAYKARLRDLQEEVAHAESLGDVARSSRAREELEFVADELAKAIGFRGRPALATTSAAERGRQLVRKQLKRTLDKISAAHPALGSHLRASIRTGYYCSYSPPTDRSVTWKL